MTASNASQLTSPSDYIAHHLQNFSTPHEPMTVTGQHAGFFLWNFEALILAAVLFAVLVCCAALTDRRALFRLDRGMSFGRRLYVWWSCAWRQWLANMLFFIAGVFAFHFLMAKAGLPLAQWTADLGRPRPAGASSTWLVALEVLSGIVANLLPVIVALVLYALLSLPLAGYMVRGGLVAHAMPAPARLGLWHATLLGWTTYVWSIPGSLAIADVAAPLPHHVSAVCRALLVVLWSMYIVLPRQLRRMTRLATPGIRS
ncbi:hypothetical protein [Paraburkholderia oxyphila]|uniref:hypothetical protein n=1 Tax=Paraburkholderia oxyphila TaxID=614212 RepID=UPI000693D5B5|nr:hypothetical protein [Paraburkholderia oxyphila]